MQLPPFLFHFVTISGRAVWHSLFIHDSYCILTFDKIVILGSAPVKTAHQQSNNEKLPMVDVLFWSYDYRNSN